jgi:cytidine deaminase
MIDWDSLVTAAKNTRENAYAKFSGFKVGAALLTTDGKIFTGCNVENSSYGLTNCAERTAVFKAVSEGYRNFKALVVFTDANPPASPCGACRQVLYEFNPELEIVCANAMGVIDKYKLSDLLPEGFRLE